MVVWNDIVKCRRHKAHVEATLMMEICSFSTLWQTTRSMDYEECMHFTIIVKCWPTVTFEWKHLKKFEQGSLPSVYFKMFKWALRRTKLVSFKNTKTLEQVLAEPHSFNTEYTLVLERSISLDNKVDKHVKTAIGRRKQTQARKKQEEGGDKQANK